MDQKKKTVNDLLSCKASPMFEGPNRLNENLFLNLGSSFNIKFSQWIIKGILSGLWAWAMLLFSLLQISSAQEYIKKLPQWLQNFIPRFGY